MEHSTPADTDLQSQNDLSTSAMYEIETESHWTSNTFYHITLYMWRFCLPVIFLLGTFGNVMTIVIMRRMASEESTINIYFTATAVMDILYLVSLGVPEWLYCQFGWGSLSSSEVMGKVHASIYTGCSTISCWCLVCVTVHRAMSVVWPHRVSLLCTRRTVVLLIAGIAVFIGVLYSHNIVLSSPRGPAHNGSARYCGKISKDYVYFNETFFMYIDMLVYCLLPFIFLAASNSVLVWKLALSVKAARTRLSLGGEAEKVHSREKAANSVTLTVVVVSVAFLLLTFPLTVNAILNYSAMHDGIEPGGYAMGIEPGGYAMAETPLSLRANFLHSVCTLLSLSNSAVNFYLYSLTGRRFREEFLKVVCCLGRDRRQRPRGVSMAVSEQSTRH